MVRRAAGLVAGRQLDAYSSGGGDSQGADLFIVHPDGSDRINLTPGTAAQHVFPDWQARCHTQGAISSEPTASA
jgi:hypothetical protein